MSSPCPCRGCTKAYEAGVNDERELWLLVAKDRVTDLRSCHKPDDCAVRAESIEVLMDDVEYWRERGLDGWIR